MHVSCPGEKQTRKGEYLETMQGKEVRHAEVAVGATPIDKGKAAKTVGGTDCVRSVGNDADSFGAGNEKHYQAQPHTPDHYSRQNGTRHTPQDQQPTRQCRVKRDGQSHDGKQDGIVHRGKVHMRAHATG